MGRLVHAWWELNECSHYENSTEILKKLKVEPPYNSEIPLLGIHPKEIK